MDDKLLFLLPAILIVVAYGLVILRAGGVREWAARWRKNAEAQGGVRWVLLRTLVTVLALGLIAALIQLLLR
jgi:uncharacterized membrane protein SpoIIM required for sporulation